MTEEYDIHVMIAEYVAGLPEKPEWKMDPELKTIWAEALRSGWFKQGQAGLHDPQKDVYCCLGVYGYLAELGNMSDMSWISSTIIPYQTQTTLAYLNDQGVPFPLIADYIEANL